MHDNKKLERILNGCRMNERAAQKELYTHHYGFAMSIAVRYSSNQYYAIEMTNNVFLKIFKSMKKFAPRHDDITISFNAWFKNIVINACIDHIRKYHKKDTMPTIETSSIQVIDQKETGENILEYKEIIKQVQQLSPACRAVFNLYAIDGFTHAEIAEKLHISEGSSKSSLFKARQQLQAFFKPSNCLNYKKIGSAC